MEGLRGTTALFRNSRNQPACHAAKLVKNPLYHALPVTILKSARVMIMWYALLFQIPTVCPAQNTSHTGPVVNTAQPSRAASAQVNALIELSARHRQKGDVQRAKTYADEALANAKLGNDEQTIALAQSELGIVYYTLHGYTQALDLFQSSLEVSQKRGYRDILATSLAYIGAIHGTQGKNTEALASCGDALQVFKELENKEGQAIALSHLGFIHRNQGNFTEALDKFSASLNLSEETGFTWGIALNHSGIGTISGIRGEYAEALRRFATALKSWEELGNKQGIADTYHHIGAVNFYQGNYTDALQNYLIALKIRQELADHFKIAESYHDIGHIYLQQSNNEEALNNYLHALEKFLESGNKERIAKAHNSVGLAYSGMNNVSKALESFEASIAMQKEIGDKPGLIYSLANVGNLYIAQGKYQLARERLLTAEALAMELDDNEKLSLSTQHLGNLSLQERRFAEARQYLERSLSLAKGTGSKSTILYNYKFLAALDSAVGNYQQALAHYKLYKTYGDSILSEEKERIIAELKIGYETEKKERDILRLENERALQEIRLKRQEMFRNYMTAGFVLFVLLSFFAYNYYITKQRLKLQMLRNKIASDLHDEVGSTLSSIAIFSDIAQQQSKDVTPLLNTIGESSRKMLDAMGDIVWTINPENDQFEKIILRMKGFAYELLGAKNIGFDFTTDEQSIHLKLPMEVRKNLYLIFKEATNNIVKYSEADKALFSIKSEGDQLSMLIRDNGKGFDMNTPTNGNGLKNMTMRAKEIGGNLLIESLPGQGTSIQLKIAM